jgi:hypothetical protein
VHKVDIQSDSLVMLYLGFHTSNTDSILAQWKELQIAYHALGTGSTLEIELFNKMTWYLEVPFTQGKVCLYDSYDLSLAPCFEYIIYAQNDSIKTIEKRCPRIDPNIMVRASNLSNLGKTVSTAAFNKRYSKQAIFNKIQSYLRDRYTRQYCDGRVPTFQVEGSSTELYLVVNDLCNEVLSEEPNAFWHATLNCIGSKNCIKHERLGIYIYYKETHNGFQLTIDVDAFYGSGRFDKPRNNGYHDLQIDGPQYLKAYTSKLAEEIFNFVYKDAQLEARSDDHDWQIAMSQNTVAGYRAYQQRFPDGKHALEAKARLERLEKVQGSNSSKIRPFPWPPPRCAERYTILQDFKGRYATLSAVDKWICRALDKRSYWSRSYYSLPNGFALVTRMEQFNKKNGQCLSEDKRWVDYPVDEGDGGIIDYLSSIILPRKGFFRVFVFAVTDQPTGFSDKQVDQAEVQTWLEKGVSILPAKEKSTAVTDQHFVDVLVYEFETQDSDRKSKRRCPCGMLCPAHLERSGLKQYLH